MVQFGTIVNGVVVFDNPAKLPEGSRVRVELDEDAELWDELDDVPPPPETETYEERLEILRRSIAEMEAGLGRPAKEVMDEIAAEFGFRTPERS